MPSTDIPLWFERKFDFTFPVEQYPNVCIRLRGVPARIEEMLDGAARDMLIEKPGGKWSAQEHTGHLLDMESLWMERAENFLANGETLTVADLTNRKTNEANHNARDLAEILAEFRRARHRLSDRVENLHPALLARSLVHPRMQRPMRFVDHLYFVAEHDDHHLARIWQILH